MKLNRIVLAAAIIFSPLIMNAEQPLKATHAKAHQNRLIAKNTPAIDIIKENGQLPVIENPAAEKKQEQGLTSTTNRVLDDLLTEARKHIGKPYRHGAKGPKAFDCSGFSSYVYSQFGYKLSPASRAQATQGVEVAKGDLRKGDLVFFTSRNSGSAVGHVGIVVSADNATGKFTFIHASIKGVKISENEGYYKNRYLGARRIITD